MPSLYSFHVMVLVYVDDIIITRSSFSNIQQLISKFNTEFSLKQLGALDSFQGIEVSLGLCMVTDPLKPNDIFSYACFIENG